MKLNPRPFSYTLILAIVVTYVNQLYAMRPTSCFRLEAAPCCLLPAAHRQTATLP